MLSYFGFRLYHMVIPSAIRSQETKLESDQDHSIKAIIVKRHLKENQERIVSPIGVRRFGNSAW